MRVRLRYKLKPDNYTESCMVNVVDRWREGTCEHRGVCMKRLEKDNYYRKVVLNIQKSAEVIPFDIKRKGQCTAGTLGKDTV